MEITSRKSVLNGAVAIPASKSHTIRGLVIAGLAEGVSVLEKPLDSLDTRSAADAISAFGANVRIEGGDWIVEGVGAHPRIPENVIDVGNSGTTLYMMAGVAALADGWTVLTGDHQIRRRTAAPLLDALRPLGAVAFSTKGDGTAPLVVEGRIRGGQTSLAAVSSQYLTSLLLVCPLAGEDTRITLTVLNERPYVHMTLDWLARQGIHPEFDDSLSAIRVSGRARYRPFRRRIPADFSSAAFPLCAGVLAGGRMVLEGLDMDDPQGDKAVIDILRKMGARIETGNGVVAVEGSPLRGMEIDMNAIPDAVPMMAACACFATGTTVLGNVPQARIKETDRIAVMAEELRKLGADISELPDGLVIRGRGGLKGGRVDGRGDHRVVMALTVAGFASDSPVTVETAEAADVTYPGFWESMRALGGKIDRS